MPKERSQNPMAAHHKAEKNRALKKSKQAQQSQRNEKLARRNPERLQRQIDELKALAETQQLRPKDKADLEGLEKELRAVKKAREILGDKAPVFKTRRDDGGEGVRGGRGGVKRRRDESEEDTDEDVRNIPMPRDTPPPIPRKHHQKQQDVPKPAPAPSQTTYSSAPVLRNLTQESKRFVPASVAQNIARQKGTGGRLLEPEEADRLEKAGYGDAAKAAEEAEKEAEFEMMSRGESGGQAIENALRHVEMEEVEDEDL